jgi:hypothetical protein
MVQVVKVNRDRRLAFRKQGLQLLHRHRIILGVIEGEVADLKSLNWDMSKEISDSARHTVTIVRTCYHTCVHLAILRICDTRALDAPDRDALTARSTYYLWIPSRSVCTIRVEFASCLYGTRGVVSYVRVGPQGMTFCDVMTGQLLYDEGGAKPRGALVFKL